MEVKESSVLSEEGTEDIDLIGGLEAFLDASEKKQNSYEKIDGHLHLLPGQFSSPREAQDHQVPVPTETDSGTGDKWAVFDAQLKEAIDEEDKKRKFEELCSTERLSTQHRKRKYEKSHATFLKVKEPQNLDEDEESREYDALEKGANHKRVLTEVDFDVLKGHKLLNFDWNDSPELSRDNQALVEEYLETVYEQSRSSPPQAHHGPLAVGHEVSTMPGRSPGRKRKQSSNSAEPTVVDDPPNLSISPQTITDLEQEIANSQEAFENEGNVVNSKRVKKEKLKQNAKETDAVKSAKDDSTTYAHKNAHDSSHTNKDAQKKRSSWGALDRYKNNQANSLPDYGSEHPPPGAAKYAPSTMSGGAVGIGSFRPRNTLNNDRHNAPNLTVKSQRPAFDLQNNVYRPKKKQKIEGGSVSSSSDSHIAVIELEAYSSHKGVTPSAISGSCTRNGQSKSSGSWSAKPVPEFHDMEDNVKPKQTRRRSLGLSQWQVSKTGGPHRENAPEAPQRSVFKLPEFSEGEDPNDRIVDVDMIDPEALDDSHSGDIIQSFYKGHANPQSARQNFRGRVSKISKTTTTETGQNPPYFNGLKADQKRRSASTSKAVEELSHSKSGLVTTSQQNGVSSKIKRGLEVSAGRRGSEHDLDELALVTPESPNSKTAGHLGIANQLLGKRKQPIGSAVSNMNCQHDIESEDSEAEIKKTDIATTSPSIKRKRQKVQGEDWFDVVQVFSQSHQWLINGRAKPWSLRRKDTDGSLTVYNHEGAIVSDLVLMPDSIRQVICNVDNDDGKLQMNKSKDQTAKKASSVFLELGDSNQSYVFCEKVRLISTITLVPKSGEHLRKLFMKAKETSEAAMKRKLRENHEQDDIQLLTEESRARVAEQFDKAAATKKPSRSQGMKDQMTGGERPRSARISPSPLRRTRSSEFIGTDSEESSRKLKVPEMDTNAFYGRSTEGGNPHATRSRNPSRELAPRPPPKPRSPSPERWTETHPDWQEKWHNSIIYPQEGKNKVTVDKQDIERLDEGQFLNDNLIMFYLLWLERDLAVNSPELSGRIFFHNTFFYERLSKSAKGKKGINYEAVERWTSKVDLMSYDYIVVPVNEHTHWYLAIICNAPKLDSKLEVTVSSQLQEPSSDIRGSQSDADVPTKSTPSRRPRATSPSEIVVGENMKQVSLKDGPQDAEDDSWPNDGLERFLSSQRPPEQGTSPIVRSDDHAVEEPSKPEPSTIAFEQSPKAAAPAKRGKRKSSTLAPRKYNPKEPRIITLDSLALSHSLTCTNLRDYLIAEYRSKRGTEISPPRALGMTATVPGQKNHCDCGLFLLSYVEQFLKCPDEFTEDLLQRVDIDITYDLRKAPEMRNHIRHLLFDLQEQQKKEDMKRSKVKGEKISKAQGKDEASIPAEAVSREASKSGAPSAEPERPPSKKSTQRELSENRGTEVRSNQPPQRDRRTRESIVAHSAESERCERNTKEHTPKREIGAELATVSRAPSQEPIDLDEEAQAGPKMHTLSDNLGGVRSSISNLFPPFSRFDDDAGRSGLPQPGASRTSPLEIEDESPQKSNYDAQQPRDFDSPSRQLQEDLKSPSPEVTTPCRSLRDRSQTPYVRQEPSNTPSDLDVVQDQNRDTQQSAQEDSPTPNCPILDSSPPQTPPKLIDQTFDNDREMLFKSELATESDSYHGPDFLPSSEATTPVKSSKQRQRAAHRQMASSRKSRPQKNREPNQSSNGERRKSGFGEGRDPLETAIIGRYRSNEFKGTYTRFSDDEVSTQSPST